MYDGNPHDSDPCHECDGRTRCDDCPHNPDWIEDDYDDDKDDRCPECGAYLNGDEEVCPKCGHPLFVKICQNCGGENLPDEKYCTHCGALLIGGASTAEVCGADDDDDDDDGDGGADAFCRMLGRMAARLFMTDPIPTVPVATIRPDNPSAELYITALRGTGE